MSLRFVVNPNRHWKQFQVKRHVWAWVNTGIPVSKATDSGTRAKAECEPAGVKESYAGIHEEWGSAPHLALCKGKYVAKRLDVGKSGFDKAKKVVTVRQ